MIEFPLSFKLVFRKKCTYQQIYFLCVYSQICARVCGSVCADLSLPFTCFLSLLLLLSKLLFVYVSPLRVCVCLCRALARTPNNTPSLKKKALSVQLRQELFSKFKK